jgi:hypothetical protein
MFALRAKSGTPCKKRAWLRDDVFATGEPATFWYNTPDRPIVGMGWLNADGVVRVAFDRCVCGQSAKS